MAEGGKGSSGCVAGIAFLLIATVVGIVVCAITSSGGTDPAPKPGAASTASATTWTFAGRTVTADEGTGFTGGVPDPVAHIDSLGTDCAALSGEVEHWTSYATNNAGTETASNAIAYAEYAEAKRVAACS